MLSDAQLKAVSARVKTVPDFPVKGTLFYDITPLLADGPLFASVIEAMAAFAKGAGADAIVAPEARGFIFGAPVAYAAKLPLVIVRKPGKLPRAAYRESYSLEYNDSAGLELHQDALRPGAKVVVVDDVLATAGTVGAIARLVGRCGGSVAGYSFLIELKQLRGRAVLDQSKPLLTLLSY